MARSRILLIVASLVVALALPAICAPKAKPKPVSKPAAKPALKKAGTVNVIPGAVFALPASCKVQARWVCPPLDTKTVDDAHWSDAHFVVDAKGRPWFGVECSDFINPVGCYKFTAQKPYDDVACLENGAFIVSTSSDIGIILPPDKPTEDYKNVPVVVFQPISGLPVPQCKIFAGAGNCLYLTGENPSTKLYDVYLLRQEKLTNGSTALREYVRVLSSEQAIDAVAGDGDTTYVAVGNVILRATRSASAPVKVLTSQESIRSLAYSPQAGLFYATYGGVGYLGAKTSFPIVQMEEPDIYFQKGSLYILFSKSLGVMALDNIGDLKRFDLPMKQIPATQSKDVKVLSVRLLEGGDDLPNEADRKYSSEFDKASTRFVYCMVDLANLAKGKRKHKEVLSVQLLWPKQSGFTDSGDTTFDFGLDTPDSWGWIRFGDASAGYFYPGEYTVRTSLNGSQIDERRFTVTGEPTLMEAVQNSDAPMVRKLLDSGADCNMMTPDGDAPITVAAARGNLELIKLLLDHGAKVDTANKDGNTALLIAADWYGDNPGIIEALTEHGANVNAADKDGQTALHRLASSDKLDDMRILLEHNADPNARDSDARTPLMMLGYETVIGDWRATPEAIELLVSHGANVNLVDKSGRSAVERAVDGHNLTLVRTLVSHEADVNQECRYSDGTVHSLLFWTLVSREIEWDRLAEDELARIVRLLCDKGAVLRADEVDYVLSSKSAPLLGRKQIVAALDSNNRTVWTYKTDDPWMRKYVLRKMIGYAYTDISIARDASTYKDALSCAVAAKDRAEEWGLASQMPEVYFNCGLLAAKTGDSMGAKTYLQKYLDLAPDAPNASTAKSLLSGN